MKDRKHTTREILVSIFIFLCTPAILGASTYFIRGSLTETVRNSVIGIFMAVMILFTLEVSWQNDDFRYRNREHMLRICIVYLLSMVSCVGGSLIPVLMFPLLSLGLIFSLITNLQIGICGYTLFCTTLVLLSGASTDIFLYYFLTGFLSIILYQKQKGKFRIILPVVIITMMSIVCLTALYILKYYELTPERIINPGVGIALNVLILCIALSVIRRSIVDPYAEKYIEINDPEYNLLSQLKEHDKAAYYQAIHTAYLSDRIADKLHLDRRLAKGGGYYNKIGLLRSKNYISKNQEIGMEYKFPPDLLELVCESGGKDCFPIKKETVIVLMADAVVSSITFLIQKDASMPIDYGQVIDVVFKKKIESGILKHSTIEIGEYYSMKQYFKEEALYYDFLR